MSKTIANQSLGVVVRALRDQVDGSSAVEERSVDVDGTTLNEHAGFMRAPPAHVSFGTQIASARGLVRMSRVEFVEVPS
jgi:hypothetical protein